MNFEPYTDVWGNGVAELAKKKLFLLDMDGTIYEEDTIFDGTLDLLKLIEHIGGQYIFITNNSSKSVADYIKKVTKFGIKADVDNFFTSTQATILYLKQNYPGKKVYCQGTKSLLQELKDSGIRVTEEIESDIGIILVGFDTELTSNKLRKTCELLQRDLPYIATNPDLKCPIHCGFIPDCGSICNMIKAATDKEPIYIGKPEPTMINIVMGKWGYSIEETLVIGDRIYTDIAAGWNAGVTTVCVLSGEATMEQILNSNIKPTITLESVKDLWWILTQFKITGSIKGDSLR